MSGWVKVLHQTRRKTGHFGDILSSQSLGLVLKKLNITQQMQTFISNRKIPPPPQPFYDFFWDHPGEPVPEEDFWTLWCKGRLTEADTPAIRLGATPSRLTSAHLHYLPVFLQAWCPSCRPTNSVKALRTTLSPANNVNLSYPAHAYRPVYSLLF